MDKLLLTMSSSRPRTVHIRERVMCPRCRKSRVRDALSIQAKASVLRVVLGDWKGTRDHLGAEPIVPAGLVLIRIILSRRLCTLEVCVVEDALTIDRVVVSLYAL